MELNIYVEVFFIMQQRFIRARFHTRLVGKKSFSH